MDGTTSNNLHERMGQMGLFDTQDPFSINSLMFIFTEGSQADIQQGLGKILEKIQDQERRLDPEQNLFGTDKEIAFTQNDLIKQAIIETDFTAPYFNQDGSIVESKEAKKKNFIFNLKALFASSIPVENETIEKTILEQASNELAQAEYERVREKYINTPEWMKAPNGKDTNLTEQQWIQVRTESFKNWFGDWENNPEGASKVVDDNGEPLVVYHGTNAEFNTFDTPLNMERIFFTKNKSFADKYGAINMPVFINAKNILNVDYKGKNAFDEIKVQNETIADIEELANYAQIKGYNGIIADNVVDIGTMSSKQDINNEVIIFNPNQIKSATDNSGYFDRQSNNIYEQENNTIENLLLQNESNNIQEKERVNNYEPTDEFRAIQEESRGASREEVELFHNGSKQIDEGIRDRLSRIFERQILSSSGSNRDVNALSLINPKTNKQLKLYQNIDADTFHDIFEIVHNYLPKGDAVDIHETSDYINNKNYLTSDGLSGFSITPDGDLVSVFNLGEKGFLQTIAPIVKEKVKTLDCFNSKIQALPEIYAKTLGFKTASVLDFNYDILVEFKGKEYADYFVKTYGESPVAFMINTDKEVETRHFNKDQYGEAKDYQQSFIDTITQE